MLRFGPADAATVLVAPPLLEEANRTRAAIVALLRRLADMGIAGALPDLPGTGESLTAIEEVTLSDWRAAFAAAAAGLAGPVHVMAWRGGALVDTAATAASRWHLSPLSAPDMMRELRRLRAASADGLYAGHRLSEAMIASLDGAEPAVDAPLRVARLDSDPRAADVRLPGRPLWRAAEPGTDALLEAAVAAEVAAWIVRCAG